MQEHNEQPLHIEHRDDSNLDAGTEGTLTVDVYKNNDNVIVEATVAGVRPENMEINVTGESVSIKGSRKRSEEISESNFYYQELFWGSFSRTIILPEEVDPDQAEAKFHDGILTITMPMIKKKSSKKIEVKTS